MWLLGGMEEGLEISGMEEGLEISGMEEGLEIREKRSESELHFLFWKFNGFH